ncbi:MAG: acyl-CoA mutase large subunit family protein [Synergistaceae bacterium]|nr:acyl-CoA mutase large subunit family protein [Synergistaceae bacterium]
MQKDHEESGHCAACGGGPAGAAVVSFEEFAPVSYEAWKEAASVSLKGASFDKSMYTPTYEEIRLEPLYTIEHLKGRDKSCPGAGNLLRGVRASGYLAEPWELAQPCDAALPGDANAQLRDDLEKGATTAAVRLDSATLKGADARAGDGVFLSSLADVEKLFESVALDRCGLHIYAGASAAPLLGFVAACAKKRGIPLGKLKGCVGADPLWAWVGEGTLPCGSERLFDEMAETMRWAEKNAPQLRTVLIRGEVAHNGGASSVQEVGWAMAAAVETARAMQECGLDIGTFSRHLRFEFSLSSNFFMEIAKIRAARAVWAQIAGAFGGEDAKEVSIFGRTSFFTKTVYDPYVNMLRNTTEAFSAVLGGVDGLTVGCFDEAVRPGGEFSRRTARNTQVLLREEFDLLRPVDPAGGSWYLESLTDTLAHKVWELLQKTESEGGFTACIKAGTLQAAAAAVLEQRFKKLASRADRAVGINMYANVQERPLESAPAAPVVCCEERASRGETQAHKALEGLEPDKLGLVDRIAAVAEAEATLSEVRSSLNAGEAEKITPIGVHRWTERYEEMRSRTERFKAEKGDNVKVFLANMGPIPQHKARADFITGFMEVAGFDVLKNNGFPTTDACAEAAAASGADVAVICSTDDSYPELVPPLARAVKAKRPGTRVFLAGAPKEEFRQSYLDAGVDDFISVRSDCLGTLLDLQKAKGMF